MTRAEVAEIVEGIADSLAREPSQFQFTIKVIGMKSSVSGGGIGTMVSATGGAAASSTVGLNASASMGDVEIERANKAATADLSAFHEALRELLTTLKEGDGNGTIRTLMTRLRSITVVPSMVIDTISTALKLAELGHHI